MTTSLFRTELDSYELILASWVRFAVKASDALLCCLPATVLFLCAGSVSATGNFLPIRLANGVTVELPRNWTVLSDNQRITLDSYVQIIVERAKGPDLSSDLNFAANYYDEHGRTAGIFNIRYYPGQTATQNESRASTATDTQELDNTLRAQILEVSQQTGMQMLSWKGTAKQSINGSIAFVTEYRRASLQGGAPFRVRLVRVLAGSRSFTVTISYREDQEFFLKPICDRVIQSIRN